MPEKEAHSALSYRLNCPSTPSITAPTALLEKLLPARSLCRVLPAEKRLEPGDVLGAQPLKPQGVLRCQKPQTRSGTTSPWDHQKKAAVPCETWAFPYAHRHTVNDLVNAHAKGILLILVLHDLRGHLERAVQQKGNRSMRTVLKHLQGMLLLGQLPTS